MMEKRRFGKNLLNMNRQISIDRGDVLVLRWDDKTEIHIFCDELSRVVYECRERIYSKRLFGAVHIVNNNNVATKQDDLQFEIRRRQKAGEPLLKIYRGECDNDELFNGA